MRRGEAKGVLSAGSGVLEQMQATNADTSTLVTLTPVFRDWTALWLLPSFFPAVAASNRQ